MLICHCPMIGWGFSFFFFLNKLCWEWNLPQQVDSEDTQRVRSVLWRTVLGMPDPLLSPQECVTSNLVREALSGAPILFCAPWTLCAHAHFPRLLLGVTGCYTPTLIYCSIQHPLPSPAVMVTVCDFWMSKFSLTAFCSPRAHLSDDVSLRLFGFQGKPCSRLLCNPHTLISRTFKAQP